MTKDKALTLALAWYDSGSEVREEFQEMIESILAPMSTTCEVQPEQEPVGRISADCEGILRQEVMLYTDKPLKIGTAVYTTLPKRPWVGLTDDEIEDCMEMSIQKTCRAIEAKLKEKNT